MDWILKQAIDGGGGGLDWLDENKLAVLDLADDVVLFDETWSGMQQLTKKNRRRSKQSGSPHKRRENKADADWCF